jgi:hypothetical protein
MVEHVLTCLFTANSTNGIPQLVMIARICGSITTTASVCERAGNDFDLEASYADVEFLGSIEEQGWCVKVASFLLWWCM